MKMPKVSAMSSAASRCLSMLNESVQQCIARRGLTVGAGAAAGNTGKDADTALVLALIVALRRRYLKKAITNVKMLLMFWWVEGIKPFPALTLESSEGLRLPYAVAIAAGLAVTLWQR